MEINYHKYFPYEQDVNLSHEEKHHYMSEWN